MWQGGVLKLALGLGAVVLLIAETTGSATGDVEADKQAEFQVKRRSKRRGGGAHDVLKG